MSAYGKCQPDNLATRMYMILKDACRDAIESGIESIAIKLLAAMDVSNDQLHAMDAAANYHHNDVAAFASGIQQDEDGALVVKGRRLTSVEEDVLFGALVHRAVMRRNRVARREDS